jgi:IMP dehydrogenase
MTVVESKLEPLNYNDVLLLPQHSNIEHRNDVNLFTHDENHMPILSSPMKHISEPKFVVELGRLGGLGILHRFFNTKQEKYDVIDYISEYSYDYGISIGINNWKEDLDFIEYAYKHGCGTVVIDVASGYMERTKEAVSELVQYRSDYNMEFDIVSGNVVDFLEYFNLAKVGSNAIRVNIGTGNQCLTSKSISIGCPPLTAILNCASVKDHWPHVKLIADGGIYTPGNALTAFAFGADAVMIGSLFGRAKECENNGTIMGMSSHELQSKMGKDKKSNEGIVTKIPEDQMDSLENIFKEFTFGLKSGLSYLGCNDINKLHEMEIEYIKVK